MADEKPKPVPADWHRHVERDVSWMVNGAASQAERQRYAERIVDMVRRAHEEWSDLRERVSNWGDRDQ